MNIRVTVGVQIILSLIALSGCVFKGETPDSPTQMTIIKDGEFIILETPWPTSEPVPEFLKAVSPPTYDIPYESYVNSLDNNFPFPRGISVTGYADRLGYSAEELDWETLREKATLFVDGSEISNDLLYGGREGESGVYQFSMSWAVLLEPGVHQATIRFETNTGDYRQHTWEFNLLD